MNLSLLSETQGLKCYYKNKVLDQTIQSPDFLIDKKWLLPKHEKIYGNNIDIIVFKRKEPRDFFLRQF
jgi:hypothetical protein